MARHDVNLTLHSRIEVREDAVFDIRKDGEPLGQLTVSQGAIAWKPRGAQQRVKLDWSAFAEMMLREEWVPD